MRLAVTELVESPGGAFQGFGLRGGSDRRALGTALHGRYQRAAQSRDADYRAERPITAEWVHADWQVTLHGRADGVRPDPSGGWVVEELKTLRPGRGPHPEARRAAIFQAGLYAWMLGRELREAVSAELVWLEVGSDASEREPVSLTRAELEAQLARGLDAWIERVIADDKRRLAWREAAAHVRFPHSQLRPGQGRLMEAAENALQSGEHLLLEAGTGTGKTAAALTPALRYALAEDKRIFFFTATGLGQRIAIDVLRRLAPPGIATATRLRAKSRMCANDRLLCHESTCSYANDYTRKLEESGALARCRAEPVLEPDLAFELGRSAGLCPFELSLDASRESVVTVADFNYGFAPGVRLTPFTEFGELENAILIVDEIHNLAERVRAARSAVLSADLVAHVAERAELGSDPVHREQARLARAIETLLVESVAEATGGAATPEEWWLEQEPPLAELKALAPALEEALLATLAHHVGGPAFEDPFLGLCFELSRHWLAADERDGAFVPLLGEKNGAAGWKRACVDVSAWLGRSFSDCHALIGLSATLSPPEATREVIGLEPSRAAHVRVPSPFPAERRRVVIDPGVRTTRRARDAQAGRIARRLAAFAEAVPGNCLALLPSYDFLARIRAELPPTSRWLRAQQRSDGEPEREALLAELEGRDDVLLLAVAGGVFTESIDLAGDMLRAVAVVGPCLPALDVERRLLQERFEQDFDRGFDYAAAAPGMARVIQAAGRLIRSERDSGVVALFGARFLREPFRSWLPEEWLDGRAPEDLVGDPAAEARTFFADLPAQPSAPSGDGASGDGGLEV